MTGKTKGALEWGTQMSEAVVLEDREALKRGLMYSEILVGLLPTVQVLAASPALPSNTQTGPRHCHVGEEASCVLRGIENHTWPGGGRFGPWWVVDHAIPVLFSSTTWVIENVERGAFTTVPSRGGVWRFLQGEEAVRAYFGITSWGYLAVPPPRGWGNLCLWQNGKVLGGRSDSRK